MPRTEGQRHGIGRGLMRETGSGKLLPGEKLGRVECFPRSLRVFHYWKCRSVGWLVGCSVCRIFVLKGGKSHIHAPIGALVFILTPVAGLFVYIFLEPKAFL